MSGAEMCGGATAEPSTPLCTPSGGQAGARSSRVLPEQTFNIQILGMLDNCQPLAVASALLVRFTKEAVMEDPKFTKGFKFVQAQAAQFGVERTEEIMESIFKINNGRPANDPYIMGCRAGIEKMKEN